LGPLLDTKKLLEPLTNLETLTMATQRDNLRVWSLPPLPKLKKLNLADRFIQSGIISGGLPTLMTFTGNLPLTEENIQNFGNLQKLTCHYFSKSISGLTNLRELNISPKNVSKVPIQWLSGITNLTALQMPRVACEPLQWEEWWLRKFFPNLKHFTATF
jgi:hypothetical protein